MPPRAERKMQAGEPSASKLPCTLSASLLEVLSQALVEEVFNRLGNASVIASAACVCKAFKEAARRVHSARLVCLNKYHEAAREGADFSFRGAKRDAAAIASASASGNGAESSHAAPSERGGAGSGSDDESSSASGDEDGGDVVVFRDVVVEFLRTKPFLVQLRIEIESRLQSKAVPEAERRRTDFWLSDPFHLVRWVPHVHATLQHLCIVDYGQQAIMRRTNILSILSQSCKVLKTLDLRNMFIDTAGMEDMPKLTNLTLRCVKVTGEALNDMNARVRNLTTLALLGVFGVTRAALDFPVMTVLCLGLSTIAQDVTLELPSLVKLQLKIMCPERLCIHAQALKFLAFNLEVRDAGAQVGLRAVRGLEEVLYGACSFGPFWSLVGTNPRLRKLFLDIPCMALAEDGRWLGVLKVPLAVPALSALAPCHQLAVLNVGPGLWHAMEANVALVRAWAALPPFRRLIVHMIPHDLDASLAALRLLARGAASLELFVHTHSPVAFDTIVPPVARALRASGSTAFLPQRWTKSLDFSCFSF